MIDSDERALLEDTLRGALADACAKPDPGRAVDAALTQIGWLELLSGEPGAALEIVFSALGSANAPGSALDDVLASALGVAPRSDLAVLLPRFGAWDPPGRLQSGQLVAQGLASSRAALARELLVVGTGDARLSASLVPIGSVELNAVRGIDPELGLHEARVSLSATGAASLDGSAWEAALALGRRALAQQIAGTARAMLALARGHALEREQFGRPIARFQAVRHRLAEALVAIEGLEAAASAGEPADGATAALAKALAGRAARSVSAHCQQVLAGIGFTTEHAFHRLLKRSMALEGLLGSADEIATELGRRLIASRHVPTLIEL